VNSVGESALSGEKSATPSQPATVPGAPTLNGATGGNASVALAWSAPGSNGGAAISGYNVYRGSSAGGETLLATLGNVTSWSDSSAVNGTTYFYKVSAVNSVGESALSGEKSATPSQPATVPGAPTLNGATGGNGSVALSWSAPGSNGGAAISGYNVYRGSSTGGETLLATLGNVTSWSDSSAVNGTTYFYKVSAVNSVGESALSGEKSATPSQPATVPGAPTLNSATGGNGSVALSWSAPGSNGGASITGYKVYRGVGAGLETILATVGNVTTWTDTAVANGTLYYYKVTAVNSVGESTRSNELSATPSQAATVPGAPTLNTATGRNGTVALAWSAPGSNGGASITGYNVYRGTSAGSETLLATLGNVTTWTDSTAVNGTTYYYKVTAVNSVGESAQSGEKSATPSQPATVPGAPTLNTATGGNGTVALAWSAPGSSGGAAITGYNVYRGTSAGSETLLATLGNVTTWTDSSATNGTTYFYKVSAVNSVGEGAQSGEKSATPSQPATVPGAPTLNTATGGNGSVAVSWSAPGSNGGAAISGYNVYRGTSAGGETLLATLGSVTTWTDSTAVNGTTYYYKVSAINSVGEGGQSNEMNARPGAPATVPGAPTLSAAKPGNHSVALAWTAPSNGGAAISGYRVYRGTSPGSETLLTTLGNVTSWTDAGAVNGTIYYYKVTAVNSAGEGSMSNEMSASPSKKGGGGGGHP
jgi:fibronectin type 3 domain-containing protein